MHIYIYMYIVKSISIHRPPIPCNCQVWDALEVCSGEALLSKCLRFGAGLNVAAFDVLDWEGFATKRGIPCKQNPLDMASTAGMAFLF